MTVLCLWIVLFLWAGAQICAGQSDTGGAIVGRAVDDEGRGVSAAQVRLEDAASGEHSDTECDSRGNFRFAEVVPGNYTLRVRAEGLSDWEADNLTVAVGTMARLTARLSPRWVHRTVLVDGSAAVARTADGQGEAAGELADAVPNNSGHWSSLAAVFSGSATGGADESASFRGLSPTMNSMVLDGMNNTLAFGGRERGTGTAGGSNGATAQAAVGEFRGGGSAAESGRGAGGMSAATRSGSNRVHGQLAFFDRGAVGQAANAFARTMVEEPAGTTVTSSGQPVLYLNGQPITYVETPFHAPDRRQEWEVSAGGPLRRERAWWFLAWTQHARNDPAVARANEPEVFFAPPSAQSLTTLEARIATSTNPLLKGCPAAGSAGSGSTARAECAWTTALGQMNGMLGPVPRTTRETIVFPKVQWRVNQRNQITAQYNSMRRTGLHAALGGATETDASGSFGNSSTSDDAAVARWDWFPAPGLINSARYGYSRDLLAQSPGTASAFESQFANNWWGLAPEVSLDRSEGLSFGTLANVNKREYPLETRQQLMDAATWIHGRQALRFGYDYNYVTDAIDGLNGENGEYSYATLVDFLSDMLAPSSCDGTTTGTGPYPCYSRFRQTVGATQWSFQTADYAAYAANEFRLGQGLTLTLGARYEFEKVPDTNSALVNADIPQTAHLPQNMHSAGPRAGFAWDVLGRGRAVLRGGFGIFYARVPNGTVFSALTSTGSANSPRTYSYRPLDVAAPAFPHVFASNEKPYVNPNAPNHNSTAPEAVFFDPRFRRPQINQAELSLEQELGRSTVVTVTGMATDGHSLEQFIDTNIDLQNTATVFYSVAAPGNAGNVGPLGKATSPVSGYTNVVYQPHRFYYQRLNPAYGAITDVMSETDSSYRGAVVRVRRRVSRAVSLNAAYTWAHTVDDNQQEATFAERNSVYDPADLRLEHGTSNYDVRQRVAGGFLVREPWRLHGPAGMMLGGYSLSGTGSWRTGLPWSMRTMGGAPTPSCSYENWLNAGGATRDGANCLKAVTQPDETFTDNTAGMVVPILSLGGSLNGSGGEDLIPAIGRNTYRYPAAVNLDLRFTKTIRISEGCVLETMGEAYNALNHPNVTAMQTIGYRVTNDTAHANMATLTWQSGEKPGTKTVLVNGSSQTEYVFDPTAQFGGVTNANNGVVSRERQIQLGMRLRF